MTRYIIRRCLLIIPTLFGGAVLVFVLLRLAPGVVCEVKLLGEGQAVDEREIDQCREELGIDDPPGEQFMRMLIRFATFDFGRSMFSGRKITEALAARYELTLQLALMALMVSVGIGLPLGIISAMRRNTGIDYAVRVFAMAGVSIPNFWLGMMLILSMLILSQWLFGEPMLTPIVYVSFWNDPLYNLSHMVLPAFISGYSGAAILTRMTRSSLLEVLGEDYIRTAYAKGLVARLIRTRHALRNALLPVVTLIGLELAGLMGGLLITEQLFNLNGIGNLFREAVEQKDFDLIQAMVLIVVFTFTFVNLLVDIAYAWLDPRVRYA